MPITNYHLITWSAIVLCTISGSVTAYCIAQVQLDRDAVKAGLVQQVVVHGLVCRTIWVKPPAASLVER
jgi:hypothetical protein